MLELKSLWMSQLGIFQFNCTLHKINLSGQHCVNIKHFHFYIWISQQLFDQMSDMVYFYSLLWSDFNQGRFYWEHCDSGGLSCPLRLSAGSISDLLNREGKEKGCLKNKESNMAGEEFSPLPSGYVRVRIHACTCEYVGWCDYSGAAVAQGWGANPAVHI